MWVSQNTKPSMLDTIALPTALGSAPLPQVCIDALPYAQWIEAATQRLQAEWPDADRRRLRDIADELFADPRSGLLEPVPAVQGWLQLLSGHD